MDDIDLPWWPTPPADVPAAELDVDAALVAELGRTGCEGPLWERTVRRLAGLGVRVLHAVILDGRLGEASGALGRPIRLHDDELTVLRRDDGLREDVVHEAVAKGIDLFRRRTVLGGQWTVHGGARLDTYFVNGCVMALANPIRSWLTARRVDVPTDLWPPDEIDAVAEAARSAPDAIEELLEREDTDAVLAWLGPVLGKAALLKIQTGWPWAQVALALGFSPKALERRLRRFRDRHDPRPDIPRPSEAPDDRPHR